MGRLTATAFMSMGGRSSKISPKTDTCVWFLSAVSACPWRKDEYLYSMPSRLVNVRLDEERLRKAQTLRESGVACPIWCAKPLMCGSRTWRGREPHGTSKPSWSGSSSSTPIRPIFGHAETTCRTGRGTPCDHRKLDAGGDDPDRHYASGGAL